MRPHPMALLAGAAAIAGFTFAAVSTHDFVVHLDRQVHGIHCSFLPGLDSTDISGSSGCHVTMMSPYSSMFRQAIWGGIPISLPAMSVFGFLLFWVGALVISRRQEDPRATGFLVLATLLPVLASLGMAIVSFFELGAACKLCIGIYASSALAFAGALGLWRRAHSLERDVWNAPTLPADRTVPDDDWYDNYETQARPQTASAGERIDWSFLIAGFALGVAMVALPTAVYAGAAPKYERFIGACGSLTDAQGASDILLPVGPGHAETAAIEVFDPLCPACRSFERRLEASGLHDQIRRQLLLFPLDDTCNWMVDRAIHPGACAISEAMLCAGDEVETVLDWAFAEQDRILEAGGDDPDTAQRLVRERFPHLKDCIGSSAVKARLNRVLRFAVAHKLPVLTPQLYVDGVRLCDEDSDLGMEYALSRMLERAHRGDLRAETGK